MKTTLSKIHFFGGEQSRRTGWIRRAGYARADFTDNTSQQYPESFTLPDILAQLKSAGIDCAAFEKAMADRAAADYAATHPGAAELAAELYSHNYGHEKPVTLGKWAWSVTFGRWSRLVTFADGWHGYTYPKL